MCLARIPQRRQSNNTHTRHWRNSPTHTGIVSFQLMPSQERAGEPSRLYPGEHENLVMALSYRYIFSPLAICGRISHPDAVWEEEREGWEWRGGWFRFGKGARERLWRMRHWEMGLSFFFFFRFFFLSFFFLSTSSLSSFSLSSSTTSAVVTAGLWLFWLPVRSSSTTYNNVPLIDTTHIK